MRKLSPVVVSLIFVFIAPLALSQKKSKAEKVISVKAIQGRTIGFQMGDYQHVDIRVKGGRHKSFFIFKAGLSYFLALHKNNQITYTYEVADVKIPENGGLTRVERLVNAKVGDLKFDSWWKDVSSKSTLEQLDDKYGPLVRKYELK
jgi:hypothetical protein